MAAGGGAWAKKESWAMETQNGDQHFINTLNCDNQDFPTFGKWNPSYANAKSMRIAILSLWNQWFHKLSLRMKPQTPLAPKPGIRPGC